MYVGSDGTAINYTPNYSVNMILSISFWAATPHNANIGIKVIVYYSEGGSNEFEFYVNDRYTFLSRSIPGGDLDSSKTVTSIKFYTHTANNAYYFDDVNINIYSCSPWC